MKSEKAKELIEDENFDDTTMRMSSVRIFARTAVEMAEQEMQEKAIEAHKRCCEWYEEGICTYGKHDNCEDNCYYIVDFIKELKNK